jgi:mRNA interferase RelE/StbE
MRGRLLRGIETLEENPRRFGTKLLKGELKGMRRLRVGDYRVTYVISDAAHTVEIMHIGHRESFYDR